MKQHNTAMHDGFSFVFEMKNSLNNVKSHKSYKNVALVRSKWVTAAIIALASGMALLSKRVDASTLNNNVTNIQAVNKRKTNSLTSTKLSEVPANQADHIKGNVQAAWNKGYRGEGTVVAVIDSGVDPTHKDFQKMPSNPKLKRDIMQRKIAKQGYGKYVNDKFPYVYNYADRDSDYVTSDDTNPKETPHGQHVSGTVAANGQADGKAKYVVGVAPEAQLMQMRIFDQFAIDDDEKIVKAIYDATNLGADVIQMSFGSGVADQQSTNIEQKAVQYAIDHGVFVSVTASNNGNSASIDNPSKITSSSYRPGTHIGNYQPLNGGTIANPGVAKNALTVAAETSGFGKNSDMAPFSSWGPLPDFSLKPDLSAPGYKIVSTVNHNKYQTMSGTSMAGPFVAGSAALVLQKLKQVDPELKGSKLVQAVKALLMNTAKPQIQNGYTTPVSPRRQGAGQIDVGAAVSSPVYVTAEDGTSSVSLGQIDKKKTFKLYFHNLTNQTQTYIFDDFGGGYTEKYNLKNGVFYEVPLTGTHIIGSNTFNLAPKEIKELKYTLNLQEHSKNRLVEGWLRFKNKHDALSLVVPYLAYNGDLTSENIFDQNANYNKPDIQGNRLVDEDNYPRGIADRQSLRKLVNVDGKYNWQQIAKLYESGKVAFSPNNDKKGDLLKPITYLKQNIKKLKIEILDSNGKVIRELANIQGVDKSYDEGGVTKDTSLSVSMRRNPDILEWDGSVYNDRTGKSEKVPDGKYTYRMIATLWNEGPNQVQIHDFPVIVDTKAPTISNLKYNKHTHDLTGVYSDNSAGFTDYSYASVRINDRVFGYKLNEGNSSFDNIDKTSGHFRFNLNKDAQEALSSSSSKISVVLSDVADNNAQSTVVVQDDDSKNFISIWNMIDGAPFDKNSVDYDKSTNQYVLRGFANRDFYLNGQLVQVHENGFEVPVNANTTKLVFSVDKLGKNIIKTFDTFTPKAFFQWQKVNGFDGNFGIKVYTVKTNNATDAVVQAAVPNNARVRAYAKDYFTGRLYVGKVKNGIATFHVQTSVNKNKVTGKFMQALLMGWSEIIGPLYSEKQTTYQLKSPEYIGVYYDVGAKVHPIYTKRADLGIKLKDQEVSAEDFEPAVYPGHNLSNDLINNRNIHFDYLKDNNTSIFGKNAVILKYYDPNTKKFIVTGHVDKNVKSLVVLANNSHEDAIENQVKLGQNGKFKFAFNIENVAQRSVAYMYKDSSNKVHRGNLNIILDIVDPVLTLNQIKESELEIWTNHSDFNLSGKATDNLDGYKLFINGNNVYTEFLNSGYNTLAGLNSENGIGHPNPYKDYLFNQVFNLNDRGNKPTVHVFTVMVVDQVGNKVRKKIVVHFDPNYGRELTQERLTSQERQSEIPKLKDDKIKTWSNNFASAITKAFRLMHNAYIYDENGNIVLKFNKKSRMLLKKGEKIFALGNGRVVILNRIKFYEIANNQFVKVANTKIQPVRKIKLKHNAWIYNRKGKRVKGSKTLKKGTIILAYNNADKFIIKGKTFYKLPNGYFVKAANT